MATGDGRDERERSAGELAELLPIARPAVSRHLRVLREAGLVEARQVVEARGMPVNLIADYGAGWQVHVEDLAAQLAGRERCDIESRWDELLPSCEDLAASIS